MPKKRCPECRKFFTPSRDWQRFCKPKCRNDFNNAERQAELLRLRELSKLNNAEE